MRCNKAGVFIRYSGLVLFRFSRKSEGIFMHLTPLLRNYCFFGVSPIFLTQYPVMLRDTAGEKGYKQTDEMSFSTPPSLRATSPIFCVTKHPVILRDTAGRSFTIAPIVKTETPCDVPNHSKKGVLTPFCRIIFFE